MKILKVAKTHLQEHPLTPNIVLCGPQPSDSAHSAPECCKLLALSNPVEHYSSQTQHVAESDTFKTCYANRTEEEEAIPATCIDRLLASLVHSLSLSKCHPEAATLLSMRSSAFTYIISLNVQNLGTGKTTSNANRSEPDNLIKLKPGEVFPLQQLGDS
jgi:hypothetical protein